MQAVTIVQVTLDELLMKFSDVMKPLIQQVNIENQAVKNKSKTLTKREAASELSCSVPMIDKLIQQGRLEKIKVGAKVLIPRESIDIILNTKAISKNENSKKITTFKDVIHEVKERQILENKKRLNNGK